MWSNKHKPTQSPRITTLVGAQTTVRGDVVFSGGLHVEGKVVGNVEAEGGAQAILTLSEEGVIEGTVKVPTMVLNGTVHGDVHARERIELAAKARVDGDVYYRLLEMAIGAEVNGKLVHTTDEPPATRWGAGEASGEADT